MSDTINQFETNSKYWDCECEENFIHSSFKDYCPRCKKVSTDQPDSRQNEIDELYDPAKDDTKLIHESGS